MTEDSYTLYASASSRGLARRWREESERASAEELAERICCRFNRSTKGGSPSFNLLIMEFCGTCRRIW